MNSKYYHISLDVDNVINEFIPRVPEMRYPGEDSSIQRIALSTSIDGCLSAVPWGGRKLENISTGIFDMTEEEIHCIFRVYEFEYNQFEKNNFISTDELLKEGLVMDANNSDECWVINQSLKPLKTYTAILMNYDESFTDIFSKEFYLLSEDDIEEVFIEDYLIGTATKIVNTELETYDEKKSIPYEIEWDNWYEFLRTLKEDNYDSLF